MFHVFRCMNKHPPLMTSLSVRMEFCHSCSNWMPDDQKIIRHRWNSKLFYTDMLSGALFLCLIFQKSLSDVEIPRDWKCARITSIPKRVTHPLLHPIGQYPSSALVRKYSNTLFLKIFPTFIEGNKLINSHKHGFR